MAASFKVGKIEIGGGELFLIAGPCVIESEAHALKMAESITGVAKAMRLPYIFKASYDKANRTSLKSFRGLGIAAGLRILKRIKDEVKIPVLTDVHEAVLTGGGLRLSGATPDGTYVEMVEIPSHPHFIGCQFHPEFKSKPLEPHPLFASFIRASYENRLHRKHKKETAELEQFHRPVTRRS